MNSSESPLVTQLAAIVGSDWVKTDPQDLQQYGKDWTKQFAAAPAAIVLPADEQQVVSLVKLANELEFALVPSGGRTGLSGGATASNSEVVIAMDRMNRILDFDATDRYAICQAGVITEQLQQFAEDKGLFYPVDFASSGSSQLGGNVATNAGGIKVIRYGMTRSWVQGLKVVTGSGELLDLNRGLLKNATGYDLRHLFIGSEGTLGIITEITIQLANQPVEPTVMVLGAQSMTDVMEVLRAFQAKIELDAFEFFSEPALKHVIEDKGLQRPFPDPCPYYALLEFQNQDEQTMESALALFEQCLESGWISDGTISQSTAQAQALWRLREDISETIAQFTPYKNDISVRVSRVPHFVSDVDELVSSEYPDFEIIWFGHIGDGNVHLNILKPGELAAEEFFARCATVSEQVFGLVQKHGGSISAEHGVGQLKKPYLHYSRSAVEIDAMRQIKAVFDPKGVMNPGKVFDSC